MVFTQPDGLDLGSQSGGIGSAYDVARMMAFARTRMSSILEATTKPRLTVRASTGLITGIPNTNQHVGEFFGIEASKTGFTEEAGGNLVISVDVTLGRPVIIVVLDSTREARFSDAQTLYQALIKSLEKAK
jgi:D-alanyl-D-alanine carboxypeptidase